MSTKKTNQLTAHIAPLVDTREKLLALMKVIQPPFSMGFSTQVESTQKYSEVAEQMLDVALFMGQGLSALQMVIISQAFDIDIRMLVELQHMQLLIDVNEELTKSLARREKYLKEAQHEPG